MTERNEQQPYLDPSKPTITNTADTVTSPMRRRLVKGSTLALPAIITLHYSGAAAAASAGPGEDAAIPQNQSSIVHRELVDTYMDSDNTIFYKDNYISNTYRLPSDGSIYTPKSTSPTPMSPYKAVVYLQSGSPVSNGPTDTRGWKSIAGFCSIYHHGDPACP